MVTRPEKRTGELCELQLIAGGKRRNSYVFLLQIVRLLAKILCCGLR
jgi:hypothetical protein